MTTPKFLPVRPSLKSLRKQAKQLARVIAAGEFDASARARAQLPNVEVPLSQRDAQLVLAREYGYAGWGDLVAEVNKRLGNGLEWAATIAACSALARGGLLQLFARKQLLPRTLGFLAALGDIDAVRTTLDENRDELATVGCIRTMAGVCHGAG